MLLAEISAYVIASLRSGLVDQKNKSSTPPIVVTISLTNASLCNFHRSPLLRIEPVPCATVDRERRSMFPPYTSLPAPQDSLITEYRPDIPAILESMQRHTVAHCTSPRMSHRNSSYQSINQAGRGQFASSRCPFCLVRSMYSPGQGSSATPKSRKPVQPTLRSAIATHICQ